MGFLSDHAVNKGRQPEVDWLKAFCIFFMIFLHVFEECAEDTTSVYHFITIIECLTGAGAFMLCMGIGARYSRSQTPWDYVKRGFELLTVGQALYLARDSVPNLIAWFYTKDTYFLSNALLVIEADILTFAGFAFMLLALFKWLKLSDLAIALIGFGMNAFSFVLHKFFHTTGNFLLDQLLGYFVVTDAESYFALCSYFVFVACGYALGGIYPRIKDKDALSSRVMLICGPIAIGYYLLRAFVPFPLLPEFDSSEMYMIKPLTDALANIMMSLFLLALFHKLFGHRNTPKLVNHLSGHINQYYCLSYVLICPVSTLLQVTRGKLLPGTVVPLLYGTAVLVICYFYISWVERRGLPNSLTRFKAPWRQVAFAVVWIASIAIVIYVYPQLTEYATIWNNYLDG